LSCRELQLANKHTGIPIEGCQPLGIYTNLSKTTWDRLHKRHHSGLGQRIVRFGVPQGWSGPPPPRLTHIFPWRSQWVYVSLGPQEQPYHHQDYGNRQLGLASSYFKSHFNGGPHSAFAFLPFLGQKTEVPAATEGSFNSLVAAQSLTRSDHKSDRESSNSAVLISSPANMVGKKSGRALQLEEGTSNSFYSVNRYETYT
jgi:hypothetical protein